MARRHVLERTQRIPLPRAAVFAFFADPRNLEAITPAFLRFRIATSGDIPMTPGTLIEYRLSLFGVPFRWVTRITTFDRGVRFVDVQLRGPYRAWEHTHTFEDAPGGTLVRDRVEYELPLGVLGTVGYALIVRRTLARIFDHRRERIAALLQAERGAGASMPATSPPGAP